MSERTATPIAQTFTIGTGTTDLSRARARSLGVHAWIVTRAVPEPAPAAPQC